MAMVYAAHLNSITVDDLDWLRANCPGAKYSTLDKKHYSSFPTRTVVYTTDENEAALLSLRWPGTMIEIDADDYS